MAIRPAALPVRAFVRQRHDAAPLRKEREQYINHLSNQGTSPRYLRAVGSRLLHINRLLGLTELREVTVAEVQNATQRWLLHIAAHQSDGVRPSSAYTFQNAAENWLRFHNILIETPPNAGPFDGAMTGFLRHMATRLSSPDSLKNQRAKLIVFLRWVTTQHSCVSEITLSSIDKFLAEKRRAGLKPRSITGYCHTIRVFFKYAASEGWCSPSIARGVKSPPVSSFDDKPDAPQWKDVRRLFSEFQRLQTPAALRCTAVITLCSIYGLRGVEVRRLKLTDLDWINEKIVIRRAKRGPIQHFPLQFEAGEAVLRYLRGGRPACRSPYVFVTLKPPYRPVEQSVLSSLVRARIKKLQIETQRYGTHAIRHACATELMRKGSSLVEIADFLGHRSIQSVSIYAKLDKRSLGQVANFSLAGVL